MQECQGDCETSWIHIHGSSLRVEAVVSSVARDGVTGASISCAGHEGVTVASISCAGFMSGAFSESDSPSITLAAGVPGNAIHREPRDQVVFAGVTGASIFCAGHEGVTPASISCAGCLSGASSESDSPSISCAAGVLGNSIHRKLREQVVFARVTGASISCTGREGVTSANISGAGCLPGALSKSDSPRRMGAVTYLVDSTSEVEAKATLSRKVDSGVSSSSNFAADVIRGARDVHCRAECSPTQGLQYAEGPVFDDVPVNSIAVEVVCSDVLAAGVVAEQGLRCSDLQAGHFHTYGELVAASSLQEPGESCAANNDAYAIAVDEVCSDVLAAGIVAEQGLRCSDLQAGDFHTYGELVAAPSLQEVAPGRKVCPQAPELVEFPYAGEAMDVPIEVDAHGPPDFCEVAERFWRALYAKLDQLMPGCGDSATVQFTIDLCKRIEPGICGVPLEMFGLIVGHMASLEVKLLPMLIAKCRQSISRDVCKLVLDEGLYFLANAFVELLAGVRQLSNEGP